MAFFEKVRRNVELLRKQLVREELVVDRREDLDRLYALQDQLLEHKFPHEKAQFMDDIISYAGDIYREMAKACDFYYIYRKWESLNDKLRLWFGPWLRDGDIEEIVAQMKDTTYKMRRDEFMRNLEKLKGETIKTPMDPKRKDVMVASLDMIEGLIFWFESLNRWNPPIQQLDKLTDAIGRYFPQFWEERGL